MQNLNSNEKKAINELKDILISKYQLVEIKLFGSKSRGFSTKESDIDLFIILKECSWKTEIEIYELCFNISLKYDVFLSPVVYSKSETEDKLTQITPFFKTIEKEAVVL